MGDAKGSGYHEAWENQVGDGWWEDLSEMAHLTEETLLDELKRQYAGADVLFKTLIPTAVNIHTD